MERTCHEFDIYGKSALHAPFFGRAGTATFLPSSFRVCVAFLLARLFSSLFVLVRTPSRWSRPVCTFLFFFVALPRCLTSLTIPPGLFEPMAHGCLAAYASELAWEVPAGPSGTCLTCVVLSWLHSCSKSMQGAGTLIGRQACR